MEELGTLVDAPPEPSRGTSILLKTKGSSIWVEVVVLAADSFSGEGAYIVTTPELKLCRVRLKRGHVEDFRILPEDRALPDDILIEECFLVNEATDDGFFTKERLEELARRAEAILARAGSSSGFVVPAAKSSALGRSDRGGVWILMEPHPTMKLGEVVAVGGRAPTAAVGRRGLFDLGDGVGYLCQYLESRAEVAELARARVVELRGVQHVDGLDLPPVGADARTLAVSYRPSSGERFKDFATALHEQDETEFLDWPVEGPRTCRWMIDQIARAGCLPLDRHFRWCRDAEIATADRSRYEHECLSRVLQFAVCYDQLAVCNLAAFEVLCRRTQLIEFAHLENPSAPDYTGAGHFLGVQDRRGGALVSPLLNSHVAGKLREEAAVAKERRKAQEARVLTPHPKPKAAAKAEAAGGGGKP